MALGHTCRGVVMTPETGVGWTRVWPSLPGCLQLLVTRVAITLVVTNDVEAFVRIAIVGVPCPDTISANGGGFAPGGPETLRDHSVSVNGP